MSQKDIEFIRPRIKEHGWYYQDHPADEIANNAIDDIGVLLEKVDRQKDHIKNLEAQLKALQNQFLGYKDGVKLACAVMSGQRIQ